MSAASGLRPRRGRVLKDRLFLWACVASTFVAVCVLVVLLGAIVVQGWKHLDLHFLTSFPSRRPEMAGLKAALWGSIWLLAVCAVSAIPLGVASAVFLEEYAPRRRVAKIMHGFIQLNITNLAGVPSIVYGILGLTVFANMFGLFGSPNMSLYDDMFRVRTAEGRVVQGDWVSEEEGVLTLASPTQGVVAIPRDSIRSETRVYVRYHRFRLKSGEELRGAILSHGEGAITLDLHGQEGERTIASADVDRWTTANFRQWGSNTSFFYIRLPFGSSVLAGGLTLALVVLPIVIVATREALRAVPNSLREGAYALGATRWQMIWGMILPSSVPGIMTGAILALSRAVGEAAPLLVVGGFLFIMFTPRNFMDDFAAMPLQIFNWAGRPQEEFHRVAASGIIVLLVVLLTFNAAAIIIRQRFQRAH